MPNYELPTLEALWVQVRTRQDRFLLCVCYRPPDSTALFWDQFQESVDLAKQAGHTQIFITGDLNADPLTENGRKLIAFAASNNLIIHVDEPTRITPTSATILDQFLSNIPQCVDNINILSPLSTSDHCQISAQLNFQHSPSTCFKREIWKYNEADFDGFRAELTNYDWNTCFEADDVNEAANSWTQAFMSIARQFIPHKTVVIRPNDKPWYNNDLRRLRRIKERTHCRAKNSHLPDDWLSFREARNIYVHALDEARVQYERAQSDKLKSEHFLSPRKWWQTAKSFLGVSISFSIPAMLLSDGTCATDSKTKASAFNTFFLQHSNINTDNANLPPSNPLTDNVLENISLTEEEVLGLLKTTDPSKATGYDSISPRMLKEAAIAIAPSLTRLFNLSLRKCEVPNIWKMANITPVHKKDCRSTLNNYRPISILSAVGKMMEKAVFKHLFNHLRDNNLLSRFQSGFIPGDGTVNQLIHLYHVMCQALDQKKKVRIVFCDISKAFDRVWHEGLLFKLKNMGIRGPLLGWFTNYLHMRKQRVVIQGSESEWGHIQAGVPQGSVLGPLLFLIYINDISSVVHSKISLFADDTCLHISSPDVNLNSESLNQDLEAMDRWAKQWLVNFSPEKTKTMSLSLQNTGPPTNTPLMMNGAPLQETKTHKHLGININYNLKWNEHILEVIKKAGKKLDILTGLKYKLDRSTLERLYVAFIRPVLEYGDVLFDNCTEECSNMLESIQKRAGRVVTGAIRGTSSVVLYNELGWESLKHRRENNKLVFFSKVVHRNAPQYLIEHIPQTVQDNTRYNLRNNNDLIPYRCRTETFKSSFFPSMTSTWNTLDPHLKSITSAQALRAALQNNIGKNKYYLLGERNINIIMARFRMHCSDLKAHLFDMNIIDAEDCACGVREDLQHFFFDCPLYRVPRNTVIHKFNLLGIECNLQSILNGTNSDTDVNISDTITEYLIESHRFPQLN